MMTKVNQVVKKEEAPEEYGVNLSCPDKAGAAAAAAAASSKTGFGVTWPGAFPVKEEISEGRQEAPEAMTQDEDDNEDDHNYNMPLSQVSLSLSHTDETIRRLETEGELGQVVGSQSMLSQELMHSSQRSEDDDHDNGNSGRDPSFQLSQQTETSTAMARRLGLLSQEVHESDVVTSPPRRAVPSSTAGTAAQVVPTATTDRSTSSAGAAAVVSAKTPPPAAATMQQSATISDTPFRESECFSSLLEAVDKITKEEEMNAKMMAWQYNSRGGGGGSDGDDTNSQNPQEGSVQGGGGAPRNAVKRKLPLDEGNANGSSPAPISSSTSSSSPKKSRKSNVTRKKELEQRKAQETAKRAATLAERTITEPEMAKKLLLSMALVRENPRSVPSVLPHKGSVVPEGFFWAHYPPLEAVLKKHMAEYYDLSTTKCQSAQQQAFNNDLVVLVREVADQRGWRFHQTFTDKGLRDRIRCYYKTHIQNAKKRLRTMVRNPTKRANARHLCAHLDLIEKHGNDNPGDGSSSYGHVDDDDEEDDENENENDDGGDDDYENNTDHYNNHAASANVARAPSMKSDASSQHALVVGI